MRRPRTGARLPRGPACARQAGVLCHDPCTGASVPIRRSFARGGAPLCEGCRIGSGDPAGRGGPRPPLPLADHFDAQPQAHSLPGQIGPQVQITQVQFALPQLALVCSTGFIGVFMASLVLIVRRHKSPRTYSGACYILREKVYIVLSPTDRADCARAPGP